MKALLFFTEEFGNCDMVHAYCPGCERYVDDVILEDDDYVASNCLFWCNNCDEIMICPTGRNDDYTLKKLSEGRDTCGELLTKKDMIERDIPEEYHDFLCLEVSVIKIQYVSRDYKELFESESKIDPPVPFHEIDGNKHDLSHGGVYLYYKGYCPDCRRDFNSYIWGD